MALGALNPDIQQLLGGVDEAMSVEMHYGEQRIVTVQVVRASGGHADLSGVAAASLSTTVGLWDGLVEPGGLVEALTNSMTQTPVTWSTAIQSASMGTFQVLIPDLWAGVQRTPGVMTPIVALCMVKLDLDAEGQSHEVPLFVTSRYGSGKAYAGSDTLPWAEGGINFKWNIDLGELESAGTTPSGNVVNLFNGTPMRVGTANETSGIPNAPGYDLALRGNTVFQLEDAVVQRLLPAASGGTDGQVAKIDSGAWVIGDDEQGSGMGGTPDDYLKSISAVGGIVPVVSGTEQAAVSLRVLLDLDGKLNRTIPELPSALPSANLNVQPGERVKRAGRVYINIASTAQTVSHNSLLSRVKQTDGDNLPFLDVTGTGLVPVSANPTGSGGDALTRLRIGTTNYNLSGGGTTITANPSDDPTAQLLNVDIADTVFRVGRTNYYNSGSNPIVAGIAAPRFAGELAVNNLGHVYPAVDQVQQTGHTPPSITYGDFSDTGNFYSGTTTPNTGDFYHAGANEFIQKRLSQQNTDTFAQVHWTDLWTYIVSDVTGGNTAENIDYRDNWIWVGEHDTAQQAADAISHHAEKANADKHFVFSLRDKRVRSVLTYDDGTPLYNDFLTWGLPLVDSDDARNLISQYQSVREVNAGYQPTAEDYAAERLLKINDAIYRVLRSVPMDNAAEVGDWGVIATGTTIRYNGGTVDHAFRGIHHHDSDVDNPQEDDIYFVWGGRGAKVYSPAGRWLDRTVHSIQTTLGDGPWQGHYTSESEAIDHVSAAGDYVGVGYQLRRATSYTAATTTYTYHLQDIVGDVPRLTDADAEVLDFIHYITPQDSTLTVGTLGTGTSRVFGFIPDDSIGGLDPNFGDVDDQINRIYFVPTDHAVQTDLRGKICIERTEASDSEAIYDGMQLRTRDATLDNVTRVYELETDDYIADDGRRRYCTTTTIAAGYHWDDGETHEINIQNPNFERSALGTPWLWHRPFGGQEASETELTLDAVKAFARATGQTGSRAIRGTDMDEDTIMQRQMLMQNTALDTDAGGYLPMKVRDAEGSGFVRTAIKNKDVEDGQIMFAKLDQATSRQATGQLPLIGNAAGGFMFAELNSNDLGTGIVTEPKLANRGVTGAKIALATINENNLNVSNDPDATNNSLGWDNANSQLVWQPEGSGGGGTDDQVLSLGTPTTTSIRISIEDGNTITVPPATTTAAGVMPSTDKTKLDGLAANRQLPSGGTANQVLAKDTGTDYDVSWVDQTGMGGATNLAIASRGTTTLDVTSSTGTDATVPAATTTLAGLLTSADKTKLDGLELQITMVPMSDVTYNTADTADLSTRFGSGATAVTVNLDVAGNDDAEIDDLFVFQFRENLSSIDGDRQIGIRVNSSTALPIRIVDPVTQAFTNKRVENTTRYTFHFLTRQDGVFIELSPTMDLVGALSRIIPAGGANDQVLTKASGTDYDVEWTTVSGGSGSTNLGATYTTTAVTVTSSSGDNVTLTAAASGSAGVMTSTQANKLANTYRVTAANTSGLSIGGSGDSRPISLNATSLTTHTDTTNITPADDYLIYYNDDEGATRRVTLTWARANLFPAAGGTTNLGATYTGTAVTVTSSTGDDVALTAASTTAAGVMSSADKTKLNSVVGRGSGWQFVPHPNAPFGWSANSVSINLDSSYDVEGQIIVMQWADNVTSGDQSAEMRIRLGNTGNFRNIEGRPDYAHTFRDFVGSDIVEDAIYVLQRTATKWRILFATSPDGTIPSDYLTTSQIDTRLKDTTEYQQTIWLPASAWEGHSTSSPSQETHTGSSDGPDMHSWSFDQTTVEKIQTNVSMPQNWNEGTIRYRVYWTKENSQTGDVVWGLRGLSAADGGDITGGVYGTQINVQDTNQDTLEVALTSWSNAVTISNAESNAVTYLELQRDADNGNDSLADDAQMIGVEIEFTCTGIDAS